MCRCQTFIFYILHILVIRFFVRNGLFSSSTWYSLEYGQTISISKHSCSLEICVSCGCVYVHAHEYAHRCLSLYVCQAAELCDKRSSLKFSAQIFGDISFCLLP